MIDHNTIGCPPGTRLQRIQRLAHGWRVWLATNDYAYGTYILMWDTGMVERVVVRENEGDERMTIRPRDGVVRMRQEHEHA